MKFTLHWKGGASTLQAASRSRAAPNRKKGEVKLKRHEETPVLHIVCEPKEAIADARVLQTELSMALDASGGARTRHLGETLTVTQGEDVVITLSFTDPQTENANGDDPSVERVDVIVGEFVEPVGEHRDQNPTTRVLERLPRSQWRQTGDSLSHQIVIENVQTGFYVRLRGTNTDEDEPEADPRGEDPWADLWLYSNPVFVDVVPASEPH